MRDAYRRLDAAFGDRPHAIHYALKANSTLAIVRLLRALGSRVDANSMGEVDVALRCGFAPREIVFTGVGKSAGELARAVTLGVHAINVESPGELDRLDQLAHGARRDAPASRCASIPTSTRKSHPHISTGLHDNKFGVPIALARGLVGDMARRGGLVPVGIHVHIGSQITTLDPLARAAEAAVKLAARAARRRRAARAPRLRRRSGHLLRRRAGAGCRRLRRAPWSRRPAGSPLALAIEPGRSIVGPAGVLLTTVVDVKQLPGGRRFVVLDAGMTELMRPALYGAFHRIEPAVPRPGAAEPADIVGPICESTDTLRARPRARRRSRSAIWSWCAMSAPTARSLGSTYLRRPLPPEVLVDGDRWRVDPPPPDARRHAEAGGVTWPGV